MGDLKDAGRFLEHCEYDISFSFSGMGVHLRLGIGKFFERRRIQIAYHEG